MPATAEECTSIDLTTLPIGSTVMVADQHHTIDDPSLQRLTIVGDWSSDRLLKVSKQDSSTHIGAAQQTDGQKWSSPYATGRVTVPRRLRRGDEWQMSFIDVHTNRVIATQEMGAIDRLLVCRQEPQPPLTLAALPTGTCVEVMTTSAVVWLTLTAAKGVSGADDRRPIHLSSTAASFVALPPLLNYQKEIVVGRPFNTSSFGTSVVTSYRIL